MSPTPPLTKLAFLSAAIFTMGACSSAPDDPTNDNTTSSEAISVTNPNARTAFQYFLGKGLTRVQSAGIVGNLIQESSVNPTKPQIGGGPGRGIAQWSVGGRWDSASHDNVQWFARSHGGSATSLNTQLDFIWYELETFSTYGLSSLRSASSLSSAVAAFSKHFEVCGVCNNSARVRDAQEVLNAFGNLGPSSGGGKGSGGGSGSTGGHGNGGDPNSGDPDAGDPNSGDPDAGGGGGASAGCYSPTLDKEMDPNACVQSKSNEQWYECSDGSWVDRYSDPDPCNGEYPLQ